MTLFRTTTLFSVIAIILTITAQWIAQKQTWLPENDPLSTPVDIPFWTLDHQLLVAAAALVLFALVAFIAGLIRRSKQEPLIFTAVILLLGFLTISLAWFIQFMGYWIPLGQVEYWLFQRFGI